MTGVRVPLLTTTEEKRRVVRELFSIREVIAAPFDGKMMTLPWVDFLLMLAQELRAGWLVAGHDFRFGHQNAGTPALLVKKAASLGMGCDVIPAVTLEGATVSSTHIRALLERGEPEEAARFLGRPFSISGPVRHGKGLGSRIGTPTLNLVPPPEQLTPAYGVYASRVTVDGRRYAAVTNVGVRPTVEDGDQVTVESFLLDFNGDLYGRTVRAEFYKYLRPERKFPSVEALAEEIQHNADQTREFFWRVTANGSVPSAAP